MKSQIALTLTLSVILLQVIAVLCVSFRGREHCSKFCISGYGARANEFCKSCCFRNSPRGLLRTTTSTGQCMNTGQMLRFGRQKCVCSNYPVMQKIQSLGGRAGGRISGAYNGLKNRFRPGGGAGQMGGGAGSMGGGAGPMSGGGAETGGEDYPPEK